MPRQLTLHTDESGTFEGDIDRGVRVIVGLLLPAWTQARMKSVHAALEAFRQRRSLKNLHASEQELKSRDSMAGEVLDTIFKGAPEGERGLVIVLAHDRDGRLYARPGAVDAPSFAANRYHRMLVELLRQVLTRPGWTMQGDEVEFCLASRVFEVTPDEAAELEPLGYRVAVRRNYNGRDVALVFVGNNSSVRASLQTLLVASDATLRGTLRSLAMESAGSSADPRFVAADWLANYFLRCRLEPGAGFDARESRVLPACLDVIVLWWGRALDALTAAGDAAAAGDLGASLDALEGTQQPVAHGSMVAEVLREVAQKAVRALPEDPNLAERLLRRAEQITDHRQYHLLDHASRVAELVRDSHVDGPRRVRALTLLGTVANHQGDVETAKRSFADAVSILERQPMTLRGLLDLADLHNRGAVACLNAFEFDRVTARLNPLLEIIHKTVAAAIGVGGTERIAGEIAGTMAQAEAHRGNWAAASSYFASATQHLGEDHMQASFRAHAAIDAGVREDACLAAAEALGSTYGVKGYDRARGHARLESAARAVQSSLEDQRSFDAWLLLKLSERGWVQYPDRVADSAWKVLVGDVRTHHPMMLVHLAAGRLLASVGRKDEAARVLEHARSIFVPSAQQPTLRVLRVQLSAELARLRMSKSNPLVALAQELDEALDRLPSARAWFDPARTACTRRTPDAVDRLLARFTFLYR